MEATKPAEMLRTTLSTVVLVVTAVGSVFNLIQGNHLPTIMLGVVVVVTVVLIIAEMREKKEKAKREAQEQMKGAAAVRAALMVAPTHLPPPPTRLAAEAASATWRWDAAGQLVFRMTGRGKTGETAHA
jgi:hypothetical protein